MSDGKYTPLVDSTDDLPRTLRRERENRERAAREQQARELAQQTSYASEAAGRYDDPYQSVSTATDATVRRIKVPFFSLMGFFIKAVFAAVPALLILTAMLYGFGVALQQYLPQLIKMKIVITFPG